MSMIFSIDEVNEVGAVGKYLNAKFLKALPQHACKVRILGGGSQMVPDYNDKTKLRKELFVNVVSTSGSFEGEKQLPLNATNIAILRAGLGDQPNSWVGKEIGVFFDPTVKVGSEVKGGVRVKVFEADPFAKLAAAPASKAPVADDDPPF